MTPSTTLAATPAILEGYVGPCAARWQDPGDGSWYWTPSGLVLCVTDEGAVRTTQGTHLVRNVRLDLSPTPTGPSPAFWHVGALVCRQVGLDPSGGFVLRLYTARGPVMWVLVPADGLHRYFIDTMDAADEEGAVCVPDLPADPLAYPAALCAIARVVLEL